MIIFSGYNLVGTYSSMQKHVELTKGSNEVVEDDQTEVKKQLRNTVQSMIPQYIPQIAQVDFLLLMMSTL
jgi:hypothetical protein